MVLEHLLALEPLLDASIVSGSSLGCKKAELLQTDVKFLGEYVGRESRTMTGEHRTAILNWPEPIPDVPSLRRFLGVVNWVRPHMPAEFGVPLKGVSSYLGTVRSAFER